MKIVLTSGRGKGLVELQESSSHSCRTTAIISTLPLTYTILVYSDRHYSKLSNSSQIKKRLLRHLCQGLCEHVLSTSYLTQGLL